MYTADLILKMDYDITEAEAKQNKLQREFELSKKETDLIKKNIEKTLAALDAEKRKQAEINKSFASQTEETKKLAELIERMENGTASFEDFMNFPSLEAAKEKLSEMEKQLENLEKDYQKSADEADKLSDSLGKQNVQLEKQKNKTANIGDEIKSNQTKQRGFGKSFDKTEKSLSRFGKRLTSIATSALFFTVVTKALTAMREQLGKYLTQNEALKKSLAQFKGSLNVIGATLADSLAPIIKWIVDKGTYILNVIARGLSKILGKDIKQMKNLAKATEETAKATAGFDTVQVADGDKGASGNADYSALNGSLDRELDAIFTIISGAALVLGVILTFTGANIPLGLGLIAIGAVGLATEYAANWNDLPQKVKNVVGSAAFAISALALVLGVILAFSGVNIGLGIGLIILGVAGMVTTYKATWGTMSQKTKDTIASIMAIGGALFILFGLILILTGGGIPLGIGLLLLGAGMLYGAYAMSPGDSFVEKVKNLWNNVKTVVSGFIKWFSENVLDKLFGTGVGDALDGMWDAFTAFFEEIIDFFKHVFAGEWKEAGKALVNILVDLLNFGINKLNLFIQSFLGGGSKLINAFGKLFGQEWSLDASHIKIPNIPRLATGAVIPGGSPFLSILGDQPKGKRNLEAPEDLIRQIVREETGGKNFTVTATGSLAPLIRLLNLEIKQENERSTVF